MTDPDPATRTVAPTLSHLAVPIASLRPHPRATRPAATSSTIAPLWGARAFSDLPGA